MTLKFFKPCILAVLASAMTLPSMYGNIVTPGNTVPPDVFTSTAYTFLATTGPIIINPIPGSSFNATYTETVARATTAIPGVCASAGCLEFFITVSNAGPGIVERVSTASFDSFITDVGYNTTTSVAGGVAPGTVDRSLVAGVIGFNFLGSGLTTGQTTETLEIITNATNYTAGTVSIQDGTSGFGAGFAPTATPEPGYMALVGAGLVAVSFFRRKRLS